MQGNVLIVDSNAATREALAGLFESEGRSVRMAGDGTTAIALAVEAPPSVVLIDEDLADYRGVDLALHLKELTGRLYSASPCILIAIRSHLYPIQRSQLAGFDHVLSKPVGFSEFRSVLALCDVKLRRAARAATVVPAPKA